MGFILDWTRKLGQLRERVTTNTRKSGSLESRQTGTSGGMSTTELLIRLELVMGENTDLPLN